MLRILIFFSGTTAAALTSLMAWLIGRFHDVSYQPDWERFLGVQVIGAVPIALCFLLNVPMRFFVRRETQKYLTRHFIFVFTTAMGSLGNLLMVVDMPDAFNSFVTPLWFVFGFTFFNLGGARFLEVVLYGFFYFFALVWGMMLWNVNPGPDEYVSFLLIAFQLITFTPIAFMSALQLADEFHAVFAEESRSIDPSGALHCGMGIACGPVSGFYPESPPKEYDLYGHSIVLAKRYEGMRKFLLREQKPASIFILQEQVFNALPAAQQEAFLSLNLGESGLSVRDDPNAEWLYYKILGAHPRVAAAPASA